MVKFILGHRVLECVKGEGDVYESIEVLAPSHVYQYSNVYRGYTVKEVMELVREDFKWNIFVVKQIEVGNSND